MFKDKRTFKERASEKGTVVDPGSPAELLVYNVKPYMSGLSLAYLQNILQYLMQEDAGILAELAPAPGALFDLTQWVKRALDNMGTDLGFGKEMTKETLGISMDNTINQKGDK